MQLSNGALAFLLHGDGGVAGLTGLTGLTGGGAGGGGADGFGFSDTRPAARRYFKIDGPSIVVRTLQALAEEGVVDRALAGQAIRKYDLHNVKAGTSGNAGGES